MTVAIRKAGERKLAGTHGVFAPSWRGTRALIRTGIFKRKKAQSGSDENHCQSVLDGGFFGDRDFAPYKHHN